jgi:Icc protein
MIRLAQVSDPHIGGDPDYRLAGVNARRTFGIILDEVRKETFDTLMITGDIASDYSPPAYRYFFEQMETFEQPMYWLPGNHDLVGNAESVENAVPFRQVFDTEHWRIIMLDSMVPKSPNGRLGEEQLTVLAKALEENTKPHIMVFLHHNPVLIDCAWLDTQTVADADKFFEIIDKYPQVRGIFWGHIHQQFEVERNNVLLKSVPSTCIQFLPKSDDFALDTISPGYRMIGLHDDGRIETQVRRVDIPDIGVDTSCMGYE